MTISDGNLIGDKGSQVPIALGYTEIGEQDRQSDSVPDRSLIAQPDPMRSRPPVSEYVALTSAQMRECIALEDLRRALDDQAWRLDELFRQVQRGALSLQRHERRTGAELTRLCDQLVLAAVQCRVEAQRIADADAAEVAS